jgi:hypothetical protein
MGKRGRVAAYTGAAALHGCKHGGAVYLKSGAAAVKKARRRGVGKVKKRGF